jgi:hypothetical protein
LEQVETRAGMSRAPEGAVARQAAGDGFEVRAFLISHHQAHLRKVEAAR